MVRVDDLIVDLRDDVVDLDTRLLGGRTRDDLADDNADRAARQPKLRRLSRGDRRVLDPEITADDSAVRDELVRDLLHGVARDGEVDARRLTHAKCVHADDLMRRGPEERPSGVARVDRRIRLDQILEDELRRFGDASAFG